MLIATYGCLLVLEILLFLISYAPENDPHQLLNSRKFSTVLCESVFELRTLGVVMFVCWANVTRGK